jgi:glycosyltransferase involved in cell wall biosynthesis
MDLLNHAHGPITTPPSGSGLNTMSAINDSSPASATRVLLLITEDWYFRSHRLDLARAARDAGMDVLVTTRSPDQGRWIRNEGFRYVPIPFSRGSWHPLREVSAVIALARLYRREQPHLVHHVGMKPIIYGSCAARLAGIPAVVNAFAGLGSGFLMNGRWSKLLRLGLKAGLRRGLTLPNSRAIFQNRDDSELLIREQIVLRSQVRIITGSGVDHGAFSPMPEREGVPVVLLPSRMLWDKGIKEFVDAARLLRNDGTPARFVLVGKVDQDNPSHISEEQLRTWHREGVVEWWGYRDDMPEVLKCAHVVVLPSYREGCPKVLLEACACGRPVIAASVPGCREIVRDGENGFLVPKRDGARLAEAIKTLLDNPSLRARMGMRGREIVLREFSAAHVASQTLAIYRELLQNFTPSLGKCA